MTIKHVTSQPTLDPPDKRDLTTPVPRPSPPPPRSACGRRETTEVSFLFGHKGSSTKLRRRGCRSSGCGHSFRWAPPRPPSCPFSVLRRPRNLRKVGTAPIPRTKVVETRVRLVLSDYLFRTSTLPGAPPKDQLLAAPYRLPPSGTALVLVAFGCSRCV